jgi:hypothetical protein
MVRQAPDREPLLAASRLMALRSEGLLHGVTIAAEDARRDRRFADGNAENSRAGVSPGALQDYQPLGRRLCSVIVRSLTER